MLCACENRVTSPISTRTRCCAGQPLLLPLPLPLLLPLPLVLALAVAVGSLAVVCLALALLGVLTARSIVRDPVPPGLFRDRLGRDDAHGRTGQRHGRACRCGVRTRRERLCCRGHHIAGTDRMRSGLSRSIRAATARSLVQRLVPYRARLRPGAGRRLPLCGLPVPVGSVARTVFPAFGQ